MKHGSQFNRVAARQKITKELKRDATHELQSFLKISDSTYTQFASIREKLHAGVRESQSKVLGMFFPICRVKLLSKFSLYC